GKTANELKHKQVAVMHQIKFAEQPRSRLKRRISRPFYEVSQGPEDDKKLPKRVQEDLRRQAKEELRSATVLQQQGIPFAFSGQCLDKPEKLRDNLRTVI